MRQAIVFDNLGNLFRYNEGKIILRTMQTWAKAAADVEVLNIVFMSSEGKLEHFFNEVSESSRMATYPFVGDILSREAFNCIRCRDEVPNHVSDDTTLQVVELVGGRFVDLKAAVTHLNGDEDQVQSIRGALFDKVKAVLKNIDVEVAPENAAIR